MPSRLFLFLPIKTLIFLLLQRKPNRRVDRCEGSSKEEGSVDKHPTVGEGHGGKLGVGGMEVGQDSKGRSNNLTAGERGDWDRLMGGNASG